MNKNKVVFIVDENSSSRQGLERIIRTNGYQTHAFASIANSMKFIEPDEISTLILSLPVSVMSVSEYISFFKRYSKLSIIALAANNSVEIQNIAKAINAIAFFRKPIDSKALIDTIEWSQESGFKSEMNKLNH